MRAIRLGQKRLWSKVLANNLAKSWIWTWSGLEEYGGAESHRLALAGRLPFVHRKPIERSLVYSKVPTRSRSFKPRRDGVKRSPAAICLGTIVAAMRFYYRSKFVLPPSIDQGPSRSENRGDFGVQGNVGLTHKLEPGPEESGSP